MTCLRIPEDNLGLIPHLDQDSIFPPIFQIFFTDSQGLRVPGPIRDYSFVEQGHNRRMDTVPMAFLFCSVINNFIKSTAPDEAHMKSASANCLPWNEAVCVV